MRTCTLSSMLLLVLLTACATRGGVRDLPVDVGEEARFSGSVREAASAARDAVAATRMEIVEAGEQGADAWYLIAWTTDGVYIRVLCERVEPDVVAVRVASRRRIAFEGRTDWGSTLFAQIGLELERLPGSG